MHNSLKKNDSLVQEWVKNYYSDFLSIFRETERERAKGEQDFIVTIKSGPITTTTTTSALATWTPLLQTDLSCAPRRKKLIACMLFEGLLRANVP